MFLVRIGLVMTTLGWWMMALARLEDDSLAVPWWALGLGVVLYGVLALSYALGTSASLWKETMMLGALIIFPFLVPGILLLALGGVWGVVNRRKSVVGVT